MTSGLAPCSQVMRSRRNHTQMFTTPAISKWEANWIGSKWWVLEIRAIMHCHLAWKTPLWWCQKRSLRLQSVAKDRIRIGSTWSHSKAANSTHSHPIKPWAAAALSIKVIFTIDRAINLCRSTTFTAYQNNRNEYKRLNRPTSASTEFRAYNR